MENPTPNKTHPIVIVAATTVTLASLVAIAWFAGFLPVRQQNQPEPPAAVAPAPEPVAAEKAPPPRAAAQPRYDQDYDAPIARTPPRRVVRQTSSREPEYAQDSYGASAPMYERDAYGEAPRQRPQYSQYPETCRDCATVESVREVKQDGQGTGIGAVSGGLIGGVLGNQIGRGHGKTVGAVVGAVGGAYAGNEMEKNARSNRYFEITIRFDDGNTRVFTESYRPSLQRGDRVRVSNGQLVRL